MVRIRSPPGFGGFGLQVAVVESGHINLNQFIAGFSAEQCIVGAFESLDALKATHVKINMLSGLFVNGIGLTGESDQVAEGFAFRIGSRRLVIDVGANQVGAGIRPFGHGFGRDILPRQQGQGTAGIDVVFNVPAA